LKSRFVWLLTTASPFLAFLFPSSSQLFRFLPSQLHRLTIMNFPPATPDTAFNMLSSLLLLLLPLYLTLQLPFGESMEILVALGVNVLLYAFVVHMIGEVKVNMLKVKSGKDLNKPGAKEDKPDV
jgi:hypothetical protein